MIAEHCAPVGSIRPGSCTSWPASGHCGRDGRLPPTARSAFAVGLWREEGIAPAPQALVCLAQASCRLGRLDEAEALVTPLLESDLDDDTMAWALYVAGWVAGIGTGPMPSGLSLIGCFRWRAARRRAPDPRPHQSHVVGDLI